MPETFYSVDEANALVLKLKPLLERIRDTQQALAEDKTVAAVREKASHNGGGLPGRHLSELTRTLERDLHQLQEWGIVLRDPSIGLIDFFHQRHPPQRRCNPLHRPGRQRGISRQDEASGTPRQGARQEPHRGPGVARIQVCFLRHLPSRSLHREQPGDGPGRDIHAEPCQRCGGRGDVGPRSGAADDAASGRHGGEDQRPVRHRLVAGHGQVALQPVHRGKRDVHSA